MILVDNSYDLIINNPSWVYIIVPISVLVFIQMLISAYIHTPDQDVEYVGGIIAPLYLATVIIVFVLFYQLNV